MKNKSELMVITKSKKLLIYIITITEKSPVKFRYSFVTKMHNIGMDVIENLHYANNLYFYNLKRKEYQDIAMESLNS